MNSFDRFRARLGIQLLLANLFLVFVGSFIVIALSHLVSVELGEATMVIVAIAIAVIAAVFLAAAEERWLTRSHKTIAQALVHVSDEAASSPSAAADNQQAVSSGFVHEMIQSIYKISAMSKDMTSDLEERRSFLNATLDSLPVSVLLFDSHNTLKYANASGQLIIDFDYQEAIGQSMSKLLDLHYQTDETLDSWLEFCRQNKIHENHFWERVSLIRVDNTKNIFDVIAHYDKPDKSDTELLVVFVDRTDEYVADEAELDFVAIAAHELRSPITVIRGYLDVMSDETKDILTVEQHALLQKMIVNAEMLSGYVNNILNVARVDQGTIQLHIRKADWQQVLNDAYEDLKIRAQVHGKNLTLTLPETLPAVAIDRVSIIEVINNLVDNAIKYSYEGTEIVIEAKEENGQIATTVTDRGVGIPEAVVGSLFNKFYRSHRTKQGVTGTGLGLYLTKAIIDSHGGNIWVRSKEGKGSTFGFEIPTYESIADTLKKGDNDGEGIKRSSHGWIKNHSFNRR